MKLIKPAYFDTFRCIASQCPDSCCQEWDVLVDDDKAALYRSLPGSLGDRLREVMTQEDGDTYMTVIDRRCPMWRRDGLCRIQAELGEEALCKTCREFPRLTHDYGDFVEMGLELSCPEAARIILSSPDPQFTAQTLPGGDRPEYDRDAMDVLLQTRACLRRILSDRSRPVNEVLALAMMYGFHAQEELDGAEPREFDPDSALETARDLARAGNMEELLEFFRGLEVLTLTWPQRLTSPDPAPWSDAHRILARYFADRYWLQAVSDYDLISRVKFLVVSCLMIRYLGADTLQTAQQYSKEIENSIDNLESILDAAYTEPAFADVRLLGLLLL